MRTSDFDYDLSPELVASRPAARGESRLLRFGPGDTTIDGTVADLPRILCPGDLLVLNDTRVLRVRLFARRIRTGGAVELLLLEKTGEREWSSLARPAKRLRSGSRLELEDGLGAEVLGRDDDGTVRLRFDNPVESSLESIGHVPLPAYVDRPDDAGDRELYQTVYADSPGAVAAPTAGLHFSKSLLAEIESSGIEVRKLTLHVGPGTFRPVTAEEASGHEMHEERYVVPESTAAAVNAARDDERRVVAVGTTVVRALESSVGPDGTVLPARKRTSLFILPGFRFRVVDALLTNFHLPRSTLLMLVSAFAGHSRVRHLYEDAIRRGYRFYSYGDATFLERFPGDATR